MDRRAHPRVTLPMKVHVWTERDEIDAESIDLSLGGMLVAHPRQLIEVGTTLELELSPPGPMPSLRFAGEVTRIADPGGIERPSLMGVRFLDPDRDGIVLLAEAIEAHLPWLPSMYDSSDDWEEVSIDAADPAVAGRLAVRLDDGRALGHLYATALSPTALFVRTDEEIEDGTRLTLSIDPAPNGVRDLVGRVATSVRQGSSDRLLPGLGVDLGPRAWIVGQRPIFLCDRL